MTDQHLRIRVESHAGYRSEETPRRFFIGERPVEVVDVIDRWLSPEHRYFKLRGDDGGVYILCHDVVRDQWELRLFDAGRSETTRLSST